LGKKGGEAGQDELMARIVLPESRKDKHPSKKKSSLRRGKKSTQKWATEKKEGKTGV